LYLTPLAPSTVIRQMRRRMELVATLVGPDATEAAASRVRSALSGAGLAVKGPNALGPEAFELPLLGDPETARAVAATELDGLAIDVCVQPAAGRRKRLLVADMDSTIINVECLDELADFAGLKAEISAITERAMRGELAFEGALRERVGMLKGLAASALQQAYDQRVRLNPGARTMVRTMAAHGARCALVSGGFTSTAPTR
jgi:phosphoserine phosphatase